MKFAANLLLVVFAAVLLHAHSFAAGESLTLAADTIFMESGNLNNN